MDTTYMLLVRQTLRVFSLQARVHISPTSCGGWLCRAIKQWPLTSLREKLLKIGAKVVRHGCYVISFGTRGATETLGCKPV
jgi:hypothetical protein